MHLNKNWQTKILANIYENLANVLFCSYSAVLLCWFSNSARTWSSSSVKRLLGAGPMPRCALYILVKTGHPGAEMKLSRWIFSPFDSESSLK